MHKLMVSFCTVLALCAGVPVLAEAPQKGAHAKKSNVSQAKRAPQLQNAKAPISHSSNVGTPASSATALSDAQLVLASMVQQGLVMCEAMASVRVQAHPERLGYFVVQWGRQTYSMVPVVTDSGALRLEDAARGVIWMQLANKSMLLDQRQGKRLADACVTDAQAEVQLAMERNPASHLLASPVETRAVELAQRLDDR